MYIERSIHPFEVTLLEPVHGQVMELSPALWGQNRYSLLWIEEGAGLLGIEGDHVVLAEGYVYFLKPGQPEHPTLTGRVRGVLLSFQKDFIDLFEMGTTSFMRSLLLNRFFLLPGICLSAEVLPVLLSIRHALQEEYASDRPLKMEVIRNLLSAFIIYLLRDPAITAIPNENSRPADLVGSFLKLVDQHFIYKKRVSEYAGLLAITPNYLNMIVKEVSGYSAGYHIRQRIVLEAKRRAVLKRDSLKNIAFTLGFGDPAHFSKYFKNCTGVSFSQFKRTG